MDLERFSQLFRDAEVGSQPGLYIVKQNGLPGRYRRVYRCGAAGLRANGDGLGSLASRMRTYHSYFANGGKIFAALTVPRAVYAGYMREDLRGKSEVQNREARFHEELHARGVRTPAGRGERCEFFEGSLETILEALRAVWVNRPGYNLYEFTSGFALRSNPASADPLAPILRLSAHRRTGRHEQPAGSSATNTAFQQQLRSFGYAILE